MLLIIMFLNFFLSLFSTQSECCVNGAHDNFRYMEIIPHKNCTQSESCNYCCSEAERRCIIQCLNCNKWNSEEYKDIPPKEFFKRRNEQEKDLVRACIQADQVQVETLIKKKINLNVRDFCWTHGETPLMIAAYYGHNTIVDILLEAGADPNIISLQGATALINAALMSHEKPITCYEKIIVKLLAAKANPELHAFDIATPLIIALRAGKRGYAIVKTLLHGNANPFHKAVSEPIHEADNEMKLLLREKMVAASL